MASSASTAWPVILLVCILCLTWSATACSSSSDAVGGNDRDGEPEGGGELDGGRGSATEIGFDAGGLSLVGDLYLPDGDGPHPGVVLVHGSGPLSRRSELAGQLNMAFGFSVPVFAELAEGLRAAGYAVLSYDKRTCGPFNGCADNGYPTPSDDLTIETLVGDARAALDALVQHPGIDTGRLAVVGHSQGAGFVPELLADDPTLATGVLLAGGHDPPDALVAAQARFTEELLRSSGAEPDQVQAATSELNQAVDDLTTLRAGGDLGSRVVLGASAGFWRSWIEHADEVPALAASLEQPLLVLSGELDWNVPPEQATAWETTLAGSPSAHQVTVLPCVTHALNCVTESDPLLIAPGDIGAQVAPDVIDTVVTFLDAQL